MGRLAAFIGRHKLLAGFAVALAFAAGGAGWYVYDQVNVPDLPVSYTVPQAAQLTADRPHETLYRVDPLRSSVTYEVEEVLAGVESTARGTTQGIAGDLVVDDADPGRSRAGEVVVNVAQLHSDEALRDRRLRHDFLQSGDYPLAVFEPEGIEGLAGEIVDRSAYDVAIPGVLTVKETTAPVTFTGTVVRRDGEIHLQASADVLLSTFDVGPISLVGLVRTGDEATLHLDITYVDPTEVDVAEVVPAPAGALVKVESDEGGPSFAAEIAPMLAANCASCHVPGEVGAEAWTLEDAGDAAEVAGGLALVTETRFMPPWPASDDGIELAHDRSLDADAIATIRAWVDAGALLDVDADTPIEAPEPAEPLGADVHLTSSEPYEGTPEITNDYRCFVLDPGLTEQAWVAGYEFVPDRDEVVHHAVAFTADASLRDRIDAVDRAADGTGWPCYGGTGLAGGGAPLGGSGTTQFMAWAPGQGPTRFPSGTAMQLGPGDLVILQIHYHFAHSAPPDRSGMHLDLVDGTGLRPVSFGVFLAPAEIPCRAGIEEGPLCDREAAYGRAGLAMANNLHRRCGTTPESMAELTDGVARAACDHRLASDAEVIAVFGHMHEIGASFRMTLNPGTPDEQILLDIPRWDFGWQLNYEPADELIVEAGDTLRVECTWDRALLPTPRARYITWAEGTEDEMCYSTLTTVPVEER